MKRRDHGMRTDATQYFSIMNRHHWHGLDWGNDLKSKPLKNVTVCGCGKVNFGAPSAWVSDFFVQTWVHVLCPKCLDTLKNVTWRIDELLPCGHRHPQQKRPTNPICPTEGVFCCLPSLSLLTYKSPGDGRMCVRLKGQEGHYMIYT